MVVATGFPGVRGTPFRGSVERRAGDRLPGVLVDGALRFVSGGFAGDIGGARPVGLASCGGPVLLPFLNASYRF